MHSYVNITLMLQMVKLRLKDFIYCWVTLYIINNYFFVSEKKFSEVKSTFPSEMKVIKH